MREFDQNIFRETCRWQRRFLKRSPCRRNKLSQLIKAVSAGGNERCLEISVGDWALSSSLRKSSGKWDLVGCDEYASSSLSAMEGSKIEAWNADKLQFDDNIFDAVVLVDTLVCLAEARPLIKECHRILKPDGRLIVSVPRKKGFNLIRSLESLLQPAGKRVRSGYSAKEIFSLLKDGFDVPGSQLYGGFFSEMSAVLEGWIARLVVGSVYFIPSPEISQEDLYRYRKLYYLLLFGRIFSWFALALDKLFFFLPSTNLIARTKWRVWSDRRSPKIRDGRSIADAALNTKIGSAAPF